MKQGREGLRPLFSVMQMISKKGGMAFGRMNGLSRLVVLFALCSVAGAELAAQTVEQADLERCAQEPGAERKLACFEALTLAGRRPASASSTGAAKVVTAPPPPARSPESPVEPATPADESPQTAAPGIDVAVVRKSVNENPEGLSDSAISAAVTARTGVAAMPEPDPDSVTRAMVVDVTSGRFDVLYFHFDDGQIWRQAQARRFRYPKNRTFEVSITEGMMGDHQLRVEGDGPMTRVRRVK